MGRLPTLERYAFSKHGHRVLIIGHVVPLFLFLLINLGRGREGKVLPKMEASRQDTQQQKLVTSFFFDYKLMIPSAHEWTVIVHEVIALFNKDGIRLQQRQGEIDHGCIF